MNNKRSVWVVETRIAAITPGMWSQWKPWMSRPTRAEARKIGSDHHAVCKHKCGMQFRVVEYSPTSKKD